MNTNSLIERDERTVSVENASYRWAYIFLTYALLIDVIYRGIAYNEAAWDLIAFVIVGGFVGTIYQARKKILSVSWLKQSIIIACIGGIIALIITFILSMT